MVKAVVDVEVDMSRKTVGIIIIVGVLLIAAWDVVLALDGIQANTITAVLRRVPPGVPVFLSFGLGLIAGHLWWCKPNRKNDL